MDEMPDWMKRAKERTEQLEARADHVATERLIAQAKVESDGPAFWEELTKNLGSQLRFLPDAFGLEGSANIIPSGSESLCRVDVKFRGAEPRSAYIDLFYRPFGSVIRYHPQFGSDFDAPLVFTNEKLMLLWGGVFYDPEEAATQFVQGLVRTVKPDALTKV